MVKHKSEEWICDACGKTSNSDDWILKLYTWRPDRVDALVLVCPLCEGSNIYHFAYHTHIPLKEL